MFQKFLLSEYYVEYIKITKQKKILKDLGSWCPEEE